MPNKTQSLKPSPRKWGFKLTSYMTLLTSTAVLLGMLGISYFAFDILKQSKLTDSFTLLFLQLENQVDHLAEDLTRFASIVEGDVDTEGRFGRATLYRIEKRKLTYLEGEDLGELTLADLGIKKLSRVFDNHIAVVRGTEYLVHFQRSENTLTLREIPIEKWLATSLAGNRESINYLITAAGDLIYSNTLAVSESNLIRRPLMQRFVDLPTAKGQFAFTGQDGEEYYGYFHQIPYSNLITFAEMKQSQIYKVLYENTKKLLYSAAVVILIVVIILQFTLRKVRAPINELIENAALVASGNFDIAVKKQSFREINMLSFAFQSMAIDLKKREYAAQELMLEKQERAVLDQELATAGRIQTNFLPSSDEIKAFGLGLNYVYVPATHVAGDWFDVYKDGSRHILAIGDVSGHGAGSSMFTAVLATGFKEAHLIDERFDASKFLSRMNHLFLQLGKGKWHATVQLLEVDSQKRTIKLTNAGHPFPCLLSPLGSVKRVELASTPLGIDAHPNLKSREFTYANATEIVLYTDGILEARNLLGRQYGVKRLTKTLAQARKATRTNLLEAIKGDFLTHTGGKACDDDICLVTVKCA